MIKTLYISEVGRDYLVSPHCKLKEIASKDGANKVLYDTELLDFFEMVREMLGGEGRCTFGINSWYRTAAHNRKIGGASKSKHLEGIAADVVWKVDGKRVPAKLICCLFQDLGLGGIGYISEYATHIDNRKSGTYRGDERKGYGNNVGDFYSYFGVSKAQVEALKVNEPKEEGEEEMTQEKFDLMMNKWISAQAAKEPNDWSKEAREWAEKEGIITGTGAGNSYLAPCTREQVIAFLYRLAKLVDPVE